MKRTYVYLLSAALFAAAPALTLTSCSDDDATETNGGNNGGSGTDYNEDRKFTCDEQKAYFESVGQELIKEFDAANFTELNDLCKHVKDAYLDNADYDNTVVTEWFKETLDANTKFTEDITETKQRTGADGGTYYEYFTQKYYERVYVLSNYKGHFTAGEKGWTRTDADDLQFYFTGKDGQQCVLKLVTSGDEIEVPLGDAYGDYSSEWKDGNNYTTEQVYTQSIKVPEFVEMTLTQDGKTLAYTSVKTDLSKLKGDDLSTMAFSTEITAQFEDYAFHVDRLGYSVETGDGALSVSLTKGNKLLLSGSLSVENVKTDFDEDSDDPESGEHITSGGGVKISFNILGKIRIEGTCDNLLDLIDYLGACDDAEHDEATFKENLKQANALLHFGTYFNNGKTKQTDVFLGAKYYDTPWDTADKGYWRYEPVLSFDDSTSYFFADYFTASAFKSLVDSFNGLLDSFKELVK